ncbi:MAG: putative polysaccharide exporter lipoprotein precursor [Bacteroidetes bacterium]|nr:putative polysaccharide exporter lipoprotein precursor [Bacteroidota bacterium]
MKKLLLYIIPLCTLWAVSCTSSKNINYFSTTDKKLSGTTSQWPTANKEAVIGYGDMLSITVNGIDPLAVAPFNLSLVTYTSPANDSISNSAIQLYTVDTQGNINFPVVGKLKLGGLNKSEAIALIGQKLTPFLKDPLVNIRFMNSSITILGEVAKPGQYKTSSERVTILDALALAGDITIYGAKNDVQVIREQDGKIEAGRVNLNSTEVFNSPYYYLRQNDVIIVGTGKTRIFRNEHSPQYFTAISAVAAVTASVMCIVCAVQK